jgi:hypothetical protein
MVCSLAGRYQSFKEKYRLHLHCIMILRLANHLYQLLHKRRGRVVNISPSHVGVSGCNFGPLLATLNDIPHPLQANTGTVLQTRSRPLPPTSFPIHYSLVTLCSTLQLLTASISNHTPNMGGM